MNAQRAQRQLREVTGRLTELTQVAPRISEALRAVVRDLHAIGVDWQESSNHLNAIAELTSDYGYSCHVEPDGRAVLDAVTDSFTKVTGYTLAEIQACGGWEALIHPEDLASSLGRAEEIRSGKKTLHQLRIVRKDGMTRWIRYSTHSLWDPVAGRVVRMHGAVQDITEQHHAQEEREQLLKQLEREHATFQMVLQQMPACVVLVEPPHGRLLFANTQFEHIFRRPPPQTDSLAEYAQFKAFHADGRLFQPEDWPAARSLRNGDTVIAEDVIIERGDGTRGIICVSSGPVRDCAGNIILVVVTFFDATEAREAQARLRAHHERLQSLSHRLVTVQEAERRAIAQELHDEIGQALTGLKLRLEALGRQVPETIAPSLDQVCESVNELMNQVRNLSLDLRPAMLDDLGLYPALKWLIERYQAQTNIQVSFQHADIQRRFKPEVETAAFRIVQEALSNVARHAKVKQVSVRAWANPMALGVQIEDHGVGFDLGKVFACASTSGISGMHERASLLGGALTVDARLGHGARVTAEFPLILQAAQDGMDEVSADVSANAVAAYNDGSGL